MKDKLILAGYIATLICLIVSPCLRMSSALEFVDAFLISGGILLTVTSLFEILAEKEKMMPLSWVTH